MQGGVVVARPGNPVRLRLPARSVALALAAVVLFTVLPQTTRAQTGDSAKPDIIVVMVDDLAYLRNEAILKRLPNINRLFLDEGKRFNRAYNEVPLCCPARANFHSGQHSYTNGVTANHPRDFDHAKTLAVAMGEAGYLTHLIGKYMNNFDGSTVPPGWDKVSMAKTYDLERPQYWRNGRVETYRGRFFDDIIRTKAVKWMADASPQTPVFQFLSPYAPHRHRFRCGNRPSGRCLLTPAVMDRDAGARECRGVGRHKPPGYTTSRRRDPWPIPVPRAWRVGWPLTRFCESMLVIDRMVGQVQRAQRERGRPAFWVFLSDNGMAWGRHGFPMKQNPWSGHLPFYVAGPGISSEATNAGVSMIDLPVTIAEVAGAEMPWADGISFLPVLTGEATTHRSEILEHMPAPPPQSAWTYRPWEALRRDGWRLIRWATGKTELYDVVNDPGETNDRSEDEPGVVAEMTASLADLIEESRGLPRPVGVDAAPVCTTVDGC